VDDTRFPRSETQSANLGPDLKVPLSKSFTRV
jgi:hypothetical protein